MRISILSGTFGLPRRRGVLRGLDRFDNEFFNIDSNYADHLEPMTRILIEVTYEALWDAGKSFKMNLTIIKNSQESNQ